MQIPTDNAFFVLIPISLKNPQKIEIKSMLEETFHPGSNAIVDLCESRLCSYSQKEIGPSRVHFL